MTTTTMLRPYRAMDRSEGGQAVASSRKEDDLDCIKASASGFTNMATPSKQTSSSSSTPNTACIACQMSPVDSKPLSKCAKCSHSLYCSRECQVAHWDLHKATCCPLFRLVESPLGGVGLQAAVQVKRGTVLLRDAPVLSCPTSQAATSEAQAAAMHSQCVQTGFKKLSKKKQKAFLDLMSWDKYNDAQGNPTILGIYQTNSLQCGDNTGFVFFGFCRMNHSCRPNVHHYWRGDLNKLLLVAMRDIEVGEELLVLYGPSQCLDTAGRREHLSTEFGFECQCSMCVETNEEGDVRMKAINEKCASVRGLMARGQNRLALSAIDESLELMKLQGLEMLAQKLYSMGYQIAIAMKDKGANAYLRSELILKEMYEGEGSPGVIRCRELLKN